MYRGEFPRLYELKDSIDPEAKHSYFSNFDQDLGRSFHVRDIYARYERDLQGLDEVAWHHLREEARHRTTANQNNGRGWQQLFDTLNEARAFAYLKKIGCTDLRFIPRSPTRTPDIEGRRCLDRLLCEVKTINISNDEAKFRNGDIQIRSGQIALPAEFFKKLNEKVEDAKQQLFAFDADRTALYLVYINICFDDLLEELKESYFRQIDENLQRMPVTDVTLVICNEHTAFYKPLQMRFATVDNRG